MGENILEIDDIPSLSAAIITGSSGLVGSYYHFNKLIKMSLKAINPENNILFNETYHKEFKKESLKTLHPQVLACGRNFILLSNL